MSDTSRYGTTQHADAAAVTADELAGTHVGAAFANQVSGASPALFSTAPYIPPGTRAGRCVGKGGSCAAAPIRGTDKCWFHTPKDVE